MAVRFALMTWDWADLRDKWRDSYDELPRKRVPKYWEEGLHESEYEDDSEEED